MKKWAIFGVLAMVLAIAIPARADGAWDQAKKDFYRDFAQNDNVVRKTALDRMAGLNTVDAAKLLLGVYSQLKAELGGVERKKGDEIADLEKTLKPLRAAKSLSVGETDRKAKLEAELTALSTALNLKQEEYKTLLDTITGSLAKFTDPAAVGELRNLVLKSPDWTVRYAILVGLIQSKVEGVGTICLEAAKDQDTRVRIAALDGLLELKVNAAIPLFVAAVEDPQWQIRLTGVAGVEAYKSKDGVTAMIRQLAKEDGRMRDDISGALKRMTGMDFGYNAKNWDEWWTKARDTWNGQPVGGGAKPPDGGAVSGGPTGGGSVAEPPTFFGLKVTSKKIVFVLDISGSMNDPSEPPKGAQEPPTVSSGGNQPPPVPWEPGKKGTKIEVLKHEFERTVSKLDPKVSFNVIVYSSDFLQWKDKMQLATPPIRMEAIDFVKKQTANNQTNTGDALEKAFELAGMGLTDKNYAALVDTIYLMTDGSPNAGKWPNDTEIIKKVAEWNKLSKVIINTIGLGNDGNYNPDFLKRLATMTGGIFVKR